MTNDIMTELDARAAILDPQYQQTLGFIEEAKRLATTPESAPVHMDESAFDDQLRDLIDSVPIEQ